MDLLSTSSSSQQWCNYIMKTSVIGTVSPEAVGELCHDNVATLLPPSGSISAMNFEPSQWSPTTDPLSSSRFISSHSQARSANRSSLAMTDVKEQSETLLSATSNRSSIPSDLYSVHVKVKSSSPQRSYRSKRAPLGLVADGRESLTGVIMANFRLFS